MDLSIIIPMYNHEQYVEQSVRSILKNLTYKVEVIIINDASTDNSLTKVKELQEEFKNIIILSNNQNYGCAYSINRGLEIAKGTYIGINSSDDFVEDGYYQKMLDIAFKENADVVCANIAMYNEQTQDIKKFNIKDLNFAIDVEHEEFNSEPANVNSAVLLGHWTASSSSTKIIKKDLYDKYKFSGSKANDIPCIYPILATANKIIYYPELYKFYRIVEKSLSRSNDENSYNSVIDSIVLAFKLLDEIHSEEEKELLFFNNCMSYLFNGLANIDNDVLRNNCIANYYNKLIEYDSKIFIKMKSSKYFKKIFTIYNIEPEQYELLTEDLNKFLLYIKKIKDNKILMAMEEKMKNQPKVSLIIPVYNGENYLKEAIDSALAQTYENVEIIVVDDGSTDKTEEIALSYGDQIRYLKKENGGVSTALNLAIKEMTGKYFSWLSHDDKYYPEKISKQIDYLKNNNLFDSNVILYSNYDLMDNDSKIYSTAIKNHQELLEKPEYGLLRGAINGLSLLIPKKAFDECGVFDESLRCTQDYELWERMMQKYKFIHQEEVLVTTRIHASQTGQTSPRVVSEGNQLWINMMENISKERKEHLEGSEYNFYRAMLDFMKNTPYNGACDFIEKKLKEIRSQSIKDIKDIKVSVIIPFYNREKELERAVASVLNQTHKNIELILIDDCSSQEISFIKNLIEKNKNINYIKLDKNYGAAYARNKGIDLATGEYIAFLDSDDEFESQKIEKQLLEMYLCNYYFSHTSYKRRASNGNEIVIESGLLTGNAIPYIISSCGIATPTVMIKTSYLKQNNFKYNHSLEIGEDICFYLNILKNIKIIGINEPLTIVNVNENSAAYNTQKQITGIKNIITYVLNNSDLCKYDFELSNLMKVYCSLLDASHTLDFPAETTATYQKRKFKEKIRYFFYLYKNDRPKLRQIVFYKLRNHPKTLNIIRSFVRFIKKILGKYK